MKYDHFEYSEMLARSLKEIAHDDQRKRYYRATEQTTLEELRASFSSVRDTIMVAFDSQLFDYEWKTSDSLIEKYQVGILILQPASPSDTSSIFRAQKESARIAKECINKLMNDAYHYKHDCDKIDPASFQITGFGPVVDTFYGVMLNYTLDYGVNYSLNPEMWL